MYHKLTGDSKKLTQIAAVLFAAMLGWSVWWMTTCSAGGQETSTPDSTSEKPIPLPPRDQVDWKSYPSGYQALGNRELMFPISVEDWPLKIDSKHQLFVDDFLIAEIRGLVRELHRPVKHPGNPIVRADRSWEKLSTIAGTSRVMRDEATGKFRMWYVLMPFPEEVNKRIRPQPFPTRFVFCYAESDDGIHWTKPAIGRYEIEGSKENNVLLWNSPLGMVLDPRDKDPQRRYKGWFRLRQTFFPIPDSPAQGLFLYTSPDGLKWTQASDRANIPRDYGKDFPGYGTPLEFYPDPVPSVAKSKHRHFRIANVFPRYDSRLGKYVADIKFKLKGHGGKGCVGMIESDDMIHWSPPRMTMYPDILDGPDSQYYSVATFPYESMWLGLLRVRHTKRAGYKQTDIQLVSSRDGRTWSHAGNRQLVIPLGKPGSWEADYTGAGPPIVVGEEIRFYYTGSRYTGKGRYDQRAIGLATLRRDGFISLGAADKPGTLLTRPLAFDGKKLFINAEVSKGGYVKAVVCDLDAKPLDRYGMGDCVPVAADSLRGRIIWRQTNELPAASGSRQEEHVRLRFEVKNAKLYSFWIE